MRDVLGHQDLKATQRHAHLASDAIASAARDTPGFIGHGSGGTSNSLTISERDTSLELATFGLGSRRSTN